MMSNITMSMPKIVHGISIELAMNSLVTLFYEYSSENYTVALKNMIALSRDLDNFNLDKSQREDMYATIIAGVSGLFLSENKGMITESDVQNIITNVINNKHLNIPMKENDTLYNVNLPGNTTSMSHVMYIVLSDIVLVVHQLVEKKFDLPIISVKQNVQLNEESYKTLFKSVAAICASHGMMEK